MPRPVVSVQPGIDANVPTNPERGEPGSSKLGLRTRLGTIGSGGGSWAIKTAWPDSTDGSAAAGWAAGCAGLTGTTATGLRGPRTEGSLPSALAGAAGGRGQRAGKATPTGG